MDVKFASILYGDYSIETEVENDGEKLTFTFDGEFVKGQEFTLLIDYVANPYKSEMKGSAAIMGGSRVCTLLIQTKETPNKPRQIWTQGETENSSKWFPTVDKPNERCTQRVRLTIPEDYVSLSNGSLISSNQNNDGTRSDVWEMKKGHAPYLFMLAIGDYEVVKDDWEGMEVSYYVEPAYKADARAIFQHTPEMLTFFSDILDYKYPWDKYSQVTARDYVSGAMENTTASLFGQFVQKPAGDVLDDNNDRIVAHELFHHWFGDLVTCESWSNLTLNEGFANYSEYLWFEHKYGKEAADHHRMTEMQGYLAQAKK